MCVREFRQSKCRRNSKNRRRRCLSCRRKRERERGRGKHLSPLFLPLLHLAASTSRRRRRRRRDHPPRASQPTSHAMPPIHHSFREEADDDVARVRSALLSRDPRRTQTCPQFSEVEWNSHPRKFVVCSLTLYIFRPGVNRIPRRRVGDVVPLSLSFSLLSIESTSRPAIERAETETKDIHCV